jgi:hypothetical protein
MMTTAAAASPAARLRIKRRQRLRLLFQAAPSRCSTRPGCASARPCQALPRSRFAADDGTDSARPGLGVRRGDGSRLEAQALTALASSSDTVYLRPRAHAATG